VGISIGLTRLFFVLDEQGMLSAEMPAPIDALVIPMTEDLAPAIQAATALRAAGVRTQIYGERKKFKAKMGYADKLRAPFAVLLGEDEIRAGTVSVKDMRRGHAGAAGAGGGGRPHRRGAAGRAAAPPDRGISF
jgi:histidyl-tRNA synthetase